MGNSLGKRIKETRKSRGITQGVLGAQINVSPQVISNWEREYTTPDSSDIQALSKVLRVSADYLLGHVDDPSLLTREDKERLENIDPVNDLASTIRLLEDEARKMGLATTDPKFVEMLSNAFNLLRIARSQDQK